MVDNEESNYSAAIRLSDEAVAKAAKGIANVAIGTAIVFAILALTRAVLSVAEEIYRKGG